MQIRDLAYQSQLSEKTVRYYESIGVLRPPRRASNGYREYDASDVERAKFVAGARNLDLSLDDIREILAMRDKREAPCRTMLELIKHKADQIAERILHLQRMEKDLRKLYKLGLTFPTDDVDGKNCVCHLVSEHAKEYKAAI